MRTSFMTSPFPGESGLGLFGNMKVEKGLGLFKGDLEKAFQVAEELGYDGLEIALANPEEIEISKLNKLVKNYRINISSFGTGGAAVKEGLIFTSPDKSTRESAVNRIKKFIDLSSFFNSVVLIGLIRGGITINPKQGKQWITECLSECTEYASKKKVTMAFEAINRFQDDFFHSILDCKKYLEEVKFPYLGMLIDSFHMNIEDSDMWENIRQASESIVHVHYADSNRLAPGMGHFDFSKMTKVLQEVGYDGYLAAEILPYPDSYTAAKESLAKMKDCLNVVK